MPIFVDACRRSYFELGLPVVTTDEGSGTHASRFSLPAAQLPHQASGHERVGISLVEKGRVINLSFRSVKSPKSADASYGCEKVEKTFGYVFFVTF